MDDEIDIGTIRIQTARKNRGSIGSLFHFSEDASLSHNIAQKEERPSEPPPESFLHSLREDKLDRLRRWIYGIAVVNFDLDIGPIVSCIHPALKLSSQCLENIAFSSFPDSAAFDTGTQVHSFKLTSFRQEDGISSITYGFSCFSQMKDSGSRRGYIQRSIVLLSQYPYVYLFEEVIKLLANRFILLGYPALNQACQDVSEWSLPAPNQLLQLSFLEETLQVRLPASDDEVQILELPDGNKTLHTPLLACIPPSTPPSVAVLSSCLPSLWSIWELLILCEPIFVYGPNPRLTSLAIWWMRDVIRPIPLIIDFRPYITIHDRDFTSLVNKYPPRTGLVIGATNPFISTSTKHWPHRLMLGGLNKNELIYNKTIKSSHEITGALGFTSRIHKRYTSKDRPLLQTWEEAVANGGHYETIASHSLRQHFSSRTAFFLVPLNRYLNSLIPTLSQASQKSRPQSRLRTFNTADFLKSLTEHGTPLPFKSSSKRQEFYARWLKTPAFGRWLAAQDEIVSDMLQERIGIQ